MVKCVETTILLSLVSSLPAKIEALSNPCVWKMKRHSETQWQLDLNVLLLPPQKRYRAVYDYTAADDDEVSFMDGDEIVDVEQIDEGWMFGRVARTGQQGMLPANYVEAI